MTLQVFKHPCIAITKVIEPRCQIFLTESYLTGARIHLYNNVHVVLSVLLQNYYTQPKQLNSTARCPTSLPGSKRCWPLPRGHSRQSRPVWVDSRPGPKAPHAETLVNPSPVSTKRMTYQHYLPESCCNRR